MAYHAVRCTLVGALAPDEGVYPAHGFGSAAAFNAAFLAAAKADPAWAQGVVSRSHVLGCKRKIDEVPPGSELDPAAPGGTPAAAAAADGPPAAAPAAETGQ